MLRRNPTLSTMFWLIIAIITVSPLYSQDDYQEWLKKQSAGYQEYKLKEDEQFSAFLKAEWENLNAFNGIMPDKVPKPVKIPTYEPPKGKATPKPPPVTKPIRPPNIPKPKPALESSKIEATKPAKLKNGKSLKVQFLGIQLDFEIDSKMASRPRGAIDKQFVSDYWENITGADYAAPLKQAMYYRQQLELNDWGYGLLLKRLGETIYGTDDNLVDLFTWFMLLKSGYDAKVGFSSDKIILLLSSDDEIYSTSFFKSDGSERRYYTIAFGEAPDNNQSSLNIYKGNYAGSHALMDFSVRKVPTLNTILTDRVLKFSYKGTKYSVATVANKDIVELYRYYPLTPMSVFFNATVSPSVDYRLLSSLKELIKGQSEAEAVNMLLRFVQTAFAYQTDDEQFGREKYLIPDETLFYSYCDCEDRSILFAHLVRKLVGVPVIGLDYPGHIATAVNFTGDVTGDAVQYRDRRYVICDPTYINADIGMVMPQFKEVSPILIGLP